MTARRLLVGGMLFFASSAAFAFDGFEGFKESLVRHEETLLGETPSAFVVEVREIRGGSDLSDAYLFTWLELRASTNHRVLERFDVQAKRRNASTGEVEVVFQSTSIAPFLSDVLPVNDRGIREVTIEFEDGVLYAFQDGEQIVAERMIEEDAEDFELLGMSSEYLYCSYRLLREDAELQFIHSTNYVK